MSSNKKNKLGQAYLSNFDANRIRRDIYCPKTFEHNINAKRVSKITDSVNFSIQQLNIITDNRSIPYAQANLKRYNNFKDVSAQARLIIDNEELYEYNNADNLNIKSCELNISHIVDCYFAKSQRQYINGMYGCDGRFIVDKVYLDKCVEVVLLDICLYHSYSFLNEITNDNKKIEFNRRKVEFCKKLQDPHWFDTNGDYQYISLAVFAMNENGEIDLQLYKRLWDEFVSEYYGDCVHEEEPIAVQLQRHIDFKQLPNNLEKRIESLQPGAYLILRTNKEHRTESIHPILFNVFGIKKNQLRQGHIKIVPLSEFEQCEVFLENLDVSAFKIIKTN